MFCRPTSNNNVQAISNPMFAAACFGHFVNALCESNTKSGMQICDSVFRCIEPAPVTAHEYALRLSAYMQTPASAFVLGGILVQRLWERQPSYFCDLATLKIMSTACVIATKFLEDELFTNTHYAACAGVAVEELNMMECAFLTCIEFRVFASAEQFRLAEKRLENIEVLLGLPISWDTNNHSNNTDTTTTSALDSNPFCVVNVSVTTAVV
eukprot:c6079_g1_i2.p1 GENE.c6079_g1_i2~~c6079_g1_i2.p1  ORF type:complete len:211 (-),score=75.64 c6079_g1_i2:194-826(-)